MTNSQSLISHLNKRSIIIDNIRSFFQSIGFTEVNTPLLTKHPGTEPYLEVFKTTLLRQNQPDETLFLNTSPEYALKKLIALGMRNIFEITRSFRNCEDNSPYHHYEFSILEWYRTPGNYLDIMEDCQNLILYINQHLNPNNCYSLTYQNKKYSLKPPFTRLSVSQAFYTYANIDQNTLLDSQKLLSVAQKKNYKIDSTTTWEQVYNQIFLNEIEPELKKINYPVFLYDYPSSQAALAQKKSSDPRFAERFELYLAGIELANAFSELTDAQEQKQRFIEELSLRKKLGKYEYTYDRQYLQALTKLPPTGGIALGLDRLIMLFTNSRLVAKYFFKSPQV